MLHSKESSRPIVCASELCTGRAISGIQWRPGSDDVLFTVADPQEGLAQSIFRWNVRTGAVHPVVNARSEEHTSELQSLMRISYAVFCLKKKKKIKHEQTTKNKD